MTYDNNPKVMVVFQSGAAAAGSGDSCETYKQDISIADLLSMLKGGGNFIDSLRYADPRRLHDRCTTLPYDGLGGGSGRVRMQPWPDDYDFSGGSGRARIQPWPNEHRCGEPEHRKPEHGRCHDEYKRDISAWLPKPVREALTKADKYAHEKAKYDSLVQQIAEQENVPSELLHAMITVGSGYDPCEESEEGDGLMRVMPEIANCYGVHDLHDPESNVRAGAKYLRDMLDRFGGNETLATAAYYMGAECADLYKTNPAARRYVGHVMALRDLYMPVRAFSSIR